MSDLTVIVYPSDEKAEAVRQNLLNLQKEYLIELEDAVIATKDKNGQVRLSQLVNPTAVGALTGSFWGLLIGALFLIPVMAATGGTAGVFWAPQLARPWARPPGRLAGRSPISASRTI